MLLVFFYYTYLFSAWSVYRFFTAFSEPIDEFIFKPVIWILPILLIVVWHERRSITESLGLDFKNFQYDALFGMGVALLFYGVVVITAFVVYGSILVNPLNLTGNTIVIYFLTSCATAITEEIVFRGFIMTRLAASFKSRLIANIITTIIFLVIHLPILSFRHVMTTDQIVNSMMLSAAISLVDGYLFYHRNGVVAPIASHATWNFIAVLVR